MTTTVAPALSPAHRRRLGRRAQLLAGISVTYNLVEAVVAVTAGGVATSIALIGFGLDSLVEMSSGLVILWQFRHPVPESRERLALRLIGLSFFALAIYVSVESVRNLVGGGEPAPSPVGIALAAVSLLVMSVLSWAQRDRTGSQLRKRGRRLETNPAVHLSVRGAPRRFVAERADGLELGRPGRWTGDRGCRRPGGRRGLARRCMLRPGNQTTGDRVQGQVPRREQPDMPTLSDVIPDLRASSTSGSRPRSSRCTAAASPTGPAPITTTGRLVKTMEAPSRPSAGSSCLPLRDTTSSHPCKCTEAVSVLNVDHRHAQLPGRPAVASPQQELFASTVQQTPAVP